MLFKDSYITDAGATLLARAIAQNGALVWTRAATSSLNSDGYTTSQMNALNDQTFGTLTSSGAVTNAIVNDEQTSASIYAEVTNEHYDGVARTFGAWAKIEGDVSDVLVVVARCGADVTPTTINPASEGVVKAFVDFTLLISAEQAQAVEASEGYYATAAALEDEQDAREALAARVVTTHSLSDATVGDNQRILGEKTFVNDSVAEGALKFQPNGSTVHLDVYGESNSGSNSGRVWLKEGSSWYGGIVITRYSTYTQTSVRSENGARLLLSGNADGSYSYVNLTTDGQKGIIAEYSSAQSRSECKINHDSVGVSASNDLTLSGKNIHIVSTESDDVILETNGCIRGLENNKTSLGSSTYKFKDVYATEFHGNLSATTAAAQTGYFTDVASNSIVSDEIYGVLKTLWSDGVGGFFVLMVGGTNLANDDKISRGDLIYTGKSVGQGTITISYMDSSGAVLSAPATTKFRVILGGVISNVTPQFGDIWAVMVEKAQS